VLQCVGVSLHLYSLFPLSFYSYQWRGLQHTATHCNTLQHTATHCNTLHFIHISCAACPRIRVPWLIYMCSMAQSYVYHIICVMLLHSDEQHDTSAPQNRHDTTRSASRSSAIASEIVLRMVSRDHARRDSFGVSTLSHTPPLFLFLSLSLSLSFSLSLSLSHSHSFLLSLSLSPYCLPSLSSLSPLSLSLSTPTHFCSLSPSLPIVCPLSPLSLLSLSLSLSFPLSPCLSFPLSFSLFLFLSLSFSLTYTRTGTRTHTYTHTLSLFLIHTHTQNNLGIILGGILGLCLEWMTYCCCRICSLSPPLSLSHTRTHTEQPWDDFWRYILGVSRMDGIWSLQNVFSLSIPPLSLSYTHTQSHHGMILGGIL